jgi:hypothetical protein
MKGLRVFDNGGETFDRYTAVLLEPQYMGYDPQKQNPYWIFVGMSAHPFHPQGFGQHGELRFDPNAATPEELAEALGKEITFEELPPDCQRCAKGLLD